MYILCKKLQLLKSRLKIWNRDIFGNVHELVISPQVILDVIQNHIHSNGYSNKPGNKEICTNKLTKSSGQGGIFLGSKV